MTRRGGGDVAVGRLEEAVRLLGVPTRARTRVGLAHHDADDTVGTVASDDAIGFDPFPLLRALDACGARAVVMGQVAGIMHGSVELTGDLDLLWDGAEEQAPALAAAFDSVGTRLTDGEGVPVPCAVEAFGLPKVLFRSPGAAGDCCGPALPWQGLPIDDFLARCEVATAVGGYRIRYLNRADLIRMRLTAGREKDVRRADELRRLAGG